jgi:hypothetical protein
MILAFVNADFIAGPTGSALVLVGFCKPGFRHLQLSFPGSHDSFFHRNACAAGANKSYVYLENIKNVSFRNQSQSANKIKSWSVDTKKLESMLKNIL